MQRHRATWAQTVLLVTSSLVTISLWLGGCGSSATTGGRDTLPNTIIDEPDDSSTDDTNDDNTADPTVELADNYSINAVPDEFEPGKWIFEVQARRAPATTELRFVWDFSDGQTYVGPSQTFTFNTPGMHRVTVRAFTASDKLAFILTLDVEIPGVGIAPVANAGPDFEVREGDLVVLDGTASSDPDTSALTYSWTQIGTAAPVTLASANTASASFTAPNVSADTILQFSLTVSDGDSSSQDIALITVINAIDSAGFGPTADAGLDQQAYAGDTVFLDGTASTSDDGTPLLYQWSQLSGPAVTLVGHSSPVATFTVQNITTPGTVLLFRLTVIQDGLVAEDEVQITASPAIIASPPPGGGGGGGGTGGGGGGGTTPGDQCPNNPDKTVPGQCGCGEADTDSDGDGTADCVDDCPAHAGKTDPGTCGCITADTDSDGDGTPNCIDGCPNDPDKVASGTCGCGVPDTDSDADGTKDCLDGCPADATKTTPGICGCGSPDADSDSDGTPNCHDGCPNDPNKLNPGTCGCGVPDVDLNTNGTPDCNDNCGVGLDTDGDGTSDCLDGCPNDPAKTLPGTCGCGVPDTDSDADGTPNCNDLCPAHPGKTTPGVCGCATPDTDSDADGTPNCNDGCPTNPAKTSPGVCGCANPDTDSDNDGTPNCVDGCPNDAGKVGPGTCGCGTPDTDSDGDGRANCIDGCPNDPNKFAPGACGCGNSETDNDNDGTPNCIDACPNDASKTAPGHCGCGVPDTDSDSDGTANCSDACPNDPGKTAPGLCGCGTPDTDANSNGTADCLEVCATNPLQNPGFESGPVIWQYITNGGRGVVTTQFHTGTRSLEMQASSSFPRDVVQTVTITPGAGYDLSAWLRTSAISGPGATVTVEWLSGSTVVRSDSPPALTGTTAWTQRSLTLTAPANSAQARLILRLDVEPDGAGLAWFDDLVLCDRGIVDTDGDGVPDHLDSAPNNPLVCRDADADGCDDCTNGPANPANDGPDSDGDGICNAGDACPGHDDNTDANGNGVPDGCEPPTLCVNPTSLNFGSTTAQITFQVWNCGSGTLNYTVTDNAAWLSASPTSGSSTGEQDSIVATVNRTGLANNTYSGTITVTPSVGTLINIVISMTVAQGGTGAPVVQISATRTSGVSPLGVVFDATATTSSGTSRPFHELDYTWDFGDSGSTFSLAKRCSASGLPCSANSDCATGETCVNTSSNKAKSPIAGHVFELPTGVTSKTYTVTLTVKDATGASAQATQAITVNDFAGTTFYVSDVSGNDANNGLTQNTAFKSWDKGISVLFLSNGPRRLLFKRGETYTAPTAFAGGRSISNKTGPYIIGAFGTGAKPIIQSTHGSTSLEFKNSSKDVRILDLDFNGSAQAAAMATGSDFLIQRVDFRNLHRGISNAYGKKDGVLMVDCTTYNTVQYGIYFSSGSGFPASEHFAMLGCKLDVTVNSHLARLYTSRSVISNNTFLNGATGRHQLKFIGVVAPEKVEYGVIAENAFLTPGGVSWMLSVGPQNSSSQEIVENVLIERNTWNVGNADGRVAIESRGAADVTIRNNLMIGIRTAVSPGQPVFNFSAWPRWHVVNNTLYNSKSTDFTFVSSPDASNLMTAWVVRNNIISGPNFTGVVAAFDLPNMPTAQMTESNNIWHLPNQSNGNLFNIGGSSLTFAAWGAAARGSSMLDPKFVTAGTNLKLQATSPAANKGMSTNRVLEDFIGGQRPLGSAFDIGAYESH